MTGRERTGNYFCVATEYLKKQARNVRVTLSRGLWLEGRPPTGMEYGCVSGAQSGSVVLEGGCREERLRQ